MAVAFVTTGTDTNNASGAQTLITGFNPGVSDAAIFMSACDGGDTITGATLNGVAMTDEFETADTGGGFTGMHAFSLANPATGNLVVTTSGTDAAAYGIITFSGANTSDICGTWVDGGNEIGDNSSSGTVTGVDANGLFLNFTNGYIGGGAQGTVTFGANETVRINNNFTDHNCLAVSTKPGAASTTLTTTIQNATRCHTAGVYINAAAAAGGATFPHKRVGKHGFYVGPGGGMAA